MLINKISTLKFSSDSVSLKKTLFFKDLDKSVKEEKLDDLKKTDDLFLINNDFSTLLHSSAKYNQLLISRYLLRKGLNPNIKNKRGQTPFLLACRTLNEKLIKEFLLYNPDINTQDCIDETPLHKVISSPKLTDLLLNAGANPYLKNYAGENAVHKSFDYPQTLELLLKRGLNPNTLNNDQQTLFHKAAENNNIEISEILKKYNAEINLKDKNGKTPIFYITEPDILNWFLNNNANIYAKDETGIMPICYFVQSNKFNLINELLKRKIDINTRDSNGFPPLSYTNNLGMIKYLLENGANPNFHFPSGNTMLHNAVKANLVELVYWLTKYNANPNFANKSGDFPLDYATNDDIRTILLASGAKSNDRLYLHQAVKENNLQYLKNLLECDFPIDTADQKGNTAIFYSKNPEILDLLIKAGTDLTKRNKSRLSLIHHFAWAGNKTFVEYLKKYYSQEFLNSQPKTLDKCIKDFDNYNPWLKKKNKTISFSGYGINHYGTEAIREKMNYKSHLTKDKVNEIMKNAKSPDEGFVMVYKALKQEQEEFRNLRRNFLAIIQHYNYNFKQELCKIMKMNPGGSKIPVIGILVQIVNKICPEDFREELMIAMNNIGEDYNELTETYYLGKMKNQLDDYNKISEYILNGIEFVNYFNGETKLRNNIYNKIQNLIENNNLKYNNLGIKLNEMANKYQNAFDKIFDKQNEKQNKRLVKKIIWKVISLGTA